MGLLSSLLRRRLLGRAGGGAYGPPVRRGPTSPYAAAPGRRSRRRDGFGFVGPFPGYSRTTRRGSRVSVGGCCLPIPLMTVSAASAAAALAHRRRR